MDDKDNYIPMQERWKNERLFGEVIGHSRVSNEERIDIRKRSIARKLKLGHITQEQADTSLEALYEELGMLVLQ